MSQGQDAKLFQRGKIQVRNSRFVTRVSLLIRACESAGVPSRVARSGEQGQEVHEKKDCPEENRGKYHNGKRQLVPSVCTHAPTPIALINRHFLSQCHRFLQMLSNVWVHPCSKSRRVASIQPGSC